MNCRECGVEFGPNQYYHLTEWCLDCEYWLHHVAKANNPESIRTSGIHYRLGSPIQADTNKSGLGFGGRKWIVRFNDGRVVRTNNLWHQGSIPPRFRNRLPDNASLEAV